MRRYLDSEIWDSAKFTMKRTGLQEGREQSILSHGKDSVLEEQKNPAGRGGEG